jgi:hypothetical protein
MCYQHAQHTPVGTMAHRRAKSRVTMLYKIRNNLVDIAPEQCLTGGDYRTRGEHKYKIISAKNNIYKFSFFPRTIITWNYLPVWPTTRISSTLVFCRFYVTHTFLHYDVTSSLCKSWENPCYLGETSCKYVHFSVFMNC